MSADARRPEAARRHAAGRTALTLVGGPLALSVAALLIITLASAAADNPYPADGRGHDISYPQCTSVLPEAQSFAVIGVTGGRPFQENPCLTNEFAWATLTSMGPSLYMNISAALGSHADMGNTGPMGTCQPDDTPCIAYNYGFNAASYAYAYANASHAQAQNWWLDVETANS